MKRTLCLLLLAAVAAVPAFADEPPAADGSATAELDALAAALFQEPQAMAAQAYCHADCSWGPDVSCSGSSCSAQDDPNGFVQCDGSYQWCAPPPSVSVNLSVIGCNQIGDKAIYSLRAYASGGNGSFNFSWLGANATSGYTVNPNPASTVILTSGTVQVTATSGGLSDSDSVLLRSPCRFLE